MPERERWLVVGLGNPGPRYEGTPHNVGWQVASELARRWDLPRFKERFRGRFAEAAGRALLLPSTYMNESGRSVGPARGALGVELDHVVVLQDELDLPFGEVRVKEGGGFNGHNGLKSIKAHLGDAGFRRVRCGIGRPDTTDPEVVSAYVLGRWRQPRDEVDALVTRAADAVDALVDQA